MSAVITERWPPTYDAAQLASQIENLAQRGDLFKNFYAAGPDGFCQGDIIRLGSEFPYIDRDAKAAVLEGLGVQFWLLLSNTCDLDRSLDLVRWAQLVPLVDVSPSQDELRDFQAYKASRTFYVPPWKHGDPQHFLAEFTMPVTVEREALNSHASVETHLSKLGWVLLHSCLVRFLARDDGRHD